MYGLLRSHNVLLCDYNNTEREIAMTHPLEDFRQRLLDDPNIAEKLKLADKYLLGMSKMGDRFILPREHVEVLPVLEYYGNDNEGWCRYVRSIRDMLPKGARLNDVQEVFRTIEIRRVQNSRRERLDAAIKKAIELRKIKDDPAEKRAYADHCTKEWIRQRTAMLLEIRGSNGRVNEDERAVALEKFWSAIDQGITEGEIP